ncbi:MAG TPA: PqqD family peptide modification chaperone [Desulfosporosinus sp.]|nr:PqqD family peptide modification chaperone [Desulfosporosinus sp.]
MQEHSAKDKYNFALYVPVIKYMNWENINGRVKLYFSIKDPVRRLAGWLVKKSPANDLTFDELSSMTWLLVDGKKTIFEISKFVNIDNKDTMEESLRRVITFLRYIAKKGWITFKEASREPDETLA